jgi:prophage regulatory protein
MTKKIDVNGFAMNPSLRILRHRDVSEKIGVSPSRLYSLIAEGSFPRPFSITPSGRAVGWLERDVDGWILSRSGGAL